MRRFMVAAAWMAMSLLAAAPAGAFHHGHGGFGGFHGGFGGHRGFGWGGGFGGYRGFGGYGGYSGFGYGGYRGVGYRGYGFGYPGFGYGGYGLGGYGLGGYGGYGLGGYGGYGGYRGYGGYGLGGYGGFGYSGYGYPGYGYNVGYYPSYSAYPYYSGYSSGYGCSNYGSYGYGTTVGLGYRGYGLYGAVSAPVTRVIVSSRPAAPAAAAAPVVVAAKPAPLTFAVAKAPATAATLQKFLGLKDIRPATLVSASPAKGLSPPAKGLGDVLARFSNVESRRKAERMIAEGDELFRAQNFHSALQKYKFAVSTAPDLAEALWRQGHALVATHNYDLAATAFKRAIARTEDLGRGGFRLSDIYAGAAMTKAQHLESLAEWATTRSNSADPYFLLGVFLNYDGQTARADKFFQKASDLAGISGGHIAVFLSPAEEAAKPRIEGAARPAAATTPVVPISVGTEL